MQMVSALKNEFSESLGLLQQFMDDHENMVRIAGAATIISIGQLLFDPALNV